LFERSGDDLVATHSWAVPGRTPFRRCGDEPTCRGASGR
jgi:hypothetical protein